MKRKQAFTILELLVVLAIMAALLVVLTIKFGGALDEAREARIDADLTVLVAAGEQFLQRCPDETAENQGRLIEKGLLKEVQKSPVEGYQYEVVAKKGCVYACLKKGEAVYEKGDFRAEKTSTRLYLD